MNGLVITSGVSKNLDYLLAGENAGSKLLKALNLGVRVFGSTKELYDFKPIEVMTDG